MRNIYFNKTFIFNGKVIIKNDKINIWQKLFQLNFIINEKFCKYCNPIHLKLFFETYINLLIVLKIKSVIR